MMNQNYTPKKFPSSSNSVSGGEGISASSRENSFKKSKFLSVSAEKLLQTKHESLRKTYRLRSAIPAAINASKNGKRPAIPRAKSAEKLSLVVQQQPKRLKKEVPQQKVNIENVFVQRDYSEGTAVRFKTEFPSRLQGKIPENVFINSVRMINRHMEEAERHSSWTYLTSCCLCLLGNLPLFCMRIKYEYILDTVDDFVKSLNSQVFRSKGITLVSPRKHALRLLEFQVVTI